ncbi:ubiquitin-2 like Rad60 SUMO-like-domain-containing protein [Pyronema omphalodes]|nr:ubiquitin-2 like Rad60 SUMO-like-domain-containing protein [Pyronema omphalodes]
MSSPEPLSPPPKKKPTSRLKFNRLKIERKPAPTAAEKGSPPAVGTQALNTEPVTSALDFFSRAKDVYVPPLLRKRGISEEAEGKEEQSGPNKKGKKEKGTSEGEVKFESSEFRKFTIVDLDSDKDDDDITKPLRRTKTHQPSLSPLLKLENRRSSRTRTDGSPTPVRQGKDKESKSHILSLDSDSDDEVVIIDSSTKKAVSASTFTAAATASTTTPSNIPTPTQAPPKAATPYIPNAEQRRLARLQQQVSSAPIVNILITSPIDKTRPLIIKRKLDQTLKEVKEHWCKVQGFTQEQIESIFLVWKRSMRVSDYVSCKSLNIAVDGDGKGEGDGGDNNEGNGEEKEGWTGGNIHFEAMTTEIFNRIEAGEELEDEEEDEEETELKKQKEEDGERISLVLKTKGNKDEFKIKVRPNTTISDLIQAYRTAQKIPDDKKVVLYFEGDQLELDDTVTDADLEDMCMVDVHIN